MDQLRFSIPEILSLIAITQCVYIIVYMFFRSGRISRGGLPLIYFFTLSLAFLFDLLESSFGGLSAGYFYMQWAAWFLGPPLSVLLVIQIAQISQLPSLKHYWVLLLIPCAFLVSVFAASNVKECAGGALCKELQEWLTLSGFVAGAVSLLAIWMNRGVFAAMSSQKTGQERYWLVLSIIFVNIFFLFNVLASLTLNITHNEIVLVRTILGLGFLYLVGTSLFRIYPQAVHVSDAPGKPESLSEAEHKIAEKIEHLLQFEKVYQESAYSRTDLARECDASESVISRIINVHFQKSFPQLINEHRIEDAKRLLSQTDAPVKTVAEEVGFNALASFNRVFKELEGISPSTYRKAK